MIGGVTRAGITEVAPQSTPTAPSELRAAIARAYQRVTGAPASRGVLDALTAQASLETARGTSMLNYNFGGIKGASPAGATVRSKTVEVLQGKQQTIVDGFRAYKTLDEGAEDYVRTMRGSFARALAAADHGSIDGFAHELKEARYYTASEKDYARALHALANDAPASQRAALTAAPSTSATSPTTSPTTFEVLRMLDSLRTSMLRIGSSRDDE